MTSQPQGVSVSPPQSTAQFASTFMSGTLASAKRAFGTVSDTVSTLMNGRDGYPVVVYNQQENDAHVVVTQEIVSIVVNMRFTRCCARHLSKEMPGCTRSTQWW